MIVSVCSFFLLFFSFFQFFFYFCFHLFFYFYLCCSPETSTVYYTANLRSQPTTFTTSSPFNSIQLIPYRGYIYIYTYTYTHLVHYPPIHPIEHVTQASHSQRRLTPAGLEISLTSPRLSYILYPLHIYLLLRIYTECPGPASSPSSTTMTIPPSPCDPPRPSHPILPFPHHPNPTITLTPSTL